MDVHLKSLIHWLSRECLHHTMPWCYRVNYGLKVTSRNCEFHFKRIWWTYFGPTHNRTLRYLNYLQPGDVILVDRGFNVAESFAVMGATLNIPAFTRGKSQLPASDVEKL